MRSRKLYKICIYLVILGLLQPMQIYKRFTFPKIIDAVKWITENSTFFNVDLSFIDSEAGNVSSPFSRMMTKYGKTREK